MKYQLKVQPADSYERTYQYKKWETKLGDVRIEMHRENGVRDWRVTFPTMAFHAGTVCHGVGDIERMELEVTRLFETARSDLMQLQGEEARADKPMCCPQCRGFLAVGEMCGCGTTRPSHPRGNE